jgi:serine/threonine protein kinase
VAIKVLLPGRVGHGVSHERFQSEARAVSSLNHPHICTLHDVGEQDGRDYLVMELLEGETVAQRLARGPLPPDQILRHAVDIAEALDHAHRHGIVHRDLKPANVMLTKGGAKLLDFGLAKWHATQAPVGLESLATMTREPPLTDQGHVVGTLQYMAPEQLEGRPVDTRTDLFAFGALVHEMATGKKAFEATSQTALITAILSAEPPAISTLQPLSPPGLDRIVKKCLAKDPDQRWQTARDLADALKWISQDSADVASSRSIPAAPACTHENCPSTVDWSGCRIARRVIVAGLWVWSGQLARSRRLVCVSSRRFQANTGERAFLPTATSSRFSRRSTASRKSGSRILRKAIQSR